MNIDMIGVVAVVKGYGFIVIYCMHKNTPSSIFI